MASQVRGLAAAEVSRPVSGWIRAGFWISTFISVAVVVRRLVAFVNPSQSGPPQMLQLDAAFRSHELLTLLHIVPALLFVVVTPFVLLRQDGQHDLLERSMYPLGLIVAVTAYAMSTFAVGGWVERSAVFVFNTLFLYNLARAFEYRRANDRARKRTSLLRSVAVLLGIATARPVMGVFFATSRLTHLTPQQFFGYAFWVGFSINTIAVEVWLRSRQGHSPNHSRIATPDS
jgi:hypothetical protein